MVFILKIHDHTVFNSHDIGYYRSKCFADGTIGMQNSSRAALWKIETDYFPAELRQPT